MNRMRLFLATAAATVAIGPSALAADLPVKAPPRPAVTYAAYNWTGLYIGGNIGGSWGAHRHTVFDATNGNTDINDAKPDGVIGGGQIGYNWQTGPWVVGLEADIQASGQKDSFSHTFATGSDTTTDKLDYFGTARGRAGYAWDRHLLYLTAGWAYGHESIDTTTTVSGVTHTSTHGNDISDGWTVGGGWEWAFADRWSAKLEYLYIDFGSDSAGTRFVTRPHAALTINLDHLTDNIVRGGLNYKFW